MKILIFGATGMLGNAVLRVFDDSDDHEAFGTVRGIATAALLPPHLQDRLVAGIDVLDHDDCIRAMDRVRPDVVINCIGLVKQLANANDPLDALPINAMLPHRLARLSAAMNARFIHMSTDCVFSGRDGLYRESDFADADDLYGRSKYLGEVDYPNAITLRTSIIGHELGGGARSLVGRFLAQDGSVQGYSKAIFSGLPTVELARVIKDYVLPRPEMNGLWHVSAEPIDKLELLRLVAKAYGKQIEIRPDDSVRIDRSLNSDRFRAETGFEPLPWPELVRSMCNFG